MQAFSEQSSEPPILIKNGPTNAKILRCLDDGLSGKLGDGHGAALWGLRPETMG